jgi:hypothetical protein
MPTLGGGGEDVDRGELIPCAQVADGQATAVLPISLITSRRFGLDWDFDSDFELGDFISASQTDYEIK